MYNWLFPHQPLLLSTVAPTSPNRKVSSFFSVESFSVPKSLSKIFGTKNLDHKFGPESLAPKCGPKLFSSDFWPQPILRLLWTVVFGRRCPFHPLYLSWALESVWDQMGEKLKNGECDCRMANRALAKSSKISGKWGRFAFRQHPASPPTSHSSPLPSDPIWDGIPMWEPLSATYWSSTKISHCWMHSRNTDQHRGESFCKHQICEQAGTIWDRCLEMNV